MALRDYTAEAEVLAGILANVKILAETYKRGTREIQESSAGRILFGRYIECKWALGYVLLICAGERDRTNDREAIFRAANVYLAGEAPEALVYPNADSIPRTRL